LRATTELERRTEMARAELARSPSTALARGSIERKASRRLRRRTALGHCTPAQKERVRDLACIVCAQHAGECHPAHVIDSGTIPREVADDVRAVVPLCPECHFEYDEGDLDLSPHLEPRWRDSLEWAVGAVGLFTALRRITGRRWAPVQDLEAA
jgi:hypothetical protein